MLASASLADIEWLVSTEAEPWLEEAARGSGSLPALAARLRRGLSAERAALALELVELRRRGAEKFPQAARMFFSRQALEQATDAWIAAYKAQRFRDLPTLDLCCGIGGDALALAAHAPLVAVDRDERLVRMAVANAQVCGVASRLTARTGDAAGLAGDGVGPFAALHIDPDRRPDRRRTTRLSRSEPPLEVVEAWRRRALGAAVKLAPAAEVPEAWERETQREWISRGGVCRQQVAWSGELAREAGRRRATRVESGRVSTLCGRPGAGPQADVAPLGRFLHEPDPAVVAARLVDDLAEQAGFRRLDRQIAYLTSDDPQGHPLAATFAVVEALPFDPRRLRQALAARRWGRLEIKVRGLEQRPETLAPRLRVPGDEAGTLLLARIGNRALAILALRPLPA